MNVPQIFPRFYLCFSGPSAAEILYYVEQLVAHLMVWENESPPLRKSQHSQRCFIQPGADFFRLSTLYHLVLSHHSSFSVTSCSEPLGVATPRVPKRFNWKRTRFPRQPLTAYPRNPGGRCAECGPRFVLCAHFHGAEDAAGRFQPADLLSHFRTSKYQFTHTKSCCCLMFHSYN